MAFDIHQYRSIINNVKKSNIMYSVAYYQYQLKIIIFTGILANINVIPKIFSDILLKNSSSFYVLTNSL